MKFKQPIKTQNKKPHITAGLKKLGVQWLIEYSASHQHLWWFDSFVFRNSQLLKPTNRYGQLKRNYLDII